MVGCGARWRGGKCGDSRACVYKGNTRTVVVGRNNVVRETNQEDYSHTGDYGTIYIYIYMCVYTCACLSVYLPEWHLPSVRTERTTVRMSPRGKSAAPTATTIVIALVFRYLPHRMRTLSGITHHIVSQSASQR